MADNPVSSGDALPAHLGPITYGTLKATHPTVNLDRIRVLHALYRGGATLLGDPGVMVTVFPPYANEGSESYAERCRRAFYEPVLAQVINKIIAGLGQDPAQLDPPKPLPGEPGADELADMKPEDKPELDPFWARLARDATPPTDDGQAKTLDQICRFVCCEALQARYGWILVDLPTVDPTVVAKSRAEQDDAGGVRAWPIPYRADQVPDWEETDGVLIWVKSYSCTRPAPLPTRPRSITRHEWTIWTADGWTRYRVELDKQGHVVANGENTKAPPKDEDVIAPLEWGDHPFGRVPWVQLDSSPSDEPSMHIGDLIESQCRNYFNQACGDAYQRQRHFYQQLYEFLGSELPGIDETISEAQQDPGRASGKKRGPDIVQVRGKDDKAMYVSPNMDGADIAQAAIDDAREGIVRVTGQLALAQDVSGASIRRSGDSKKQDKIEEEVVLGAVGKKLLGFIRQVLVLLGAAVDLPAPTVSGYENFDVESTADTVAEAVEVEGLDIPSARFQIEHKLAVALSVLGDSIDEAIRAEIREQLEGHITQDQIDNPPLPMMVSGDDPDGDDDITKPTPPSKPTAPTKPAAPSKPTAPAKPDVKPAPKAAAK